MRNITLNEWEQTFLLDRLGSDVIPDVLLDNYDELDIDDAEQLNDAVRNLVELSDFDLDDLSEHERFTLTNAIEGATWFARLTDEVTNGTIARQYFEAEWARVQALRKKLAAQGFTVGNPPKV